MPNGYAIKSTASAFLPPPTALYGVATANADIIDVVSTTTTALGDAHEGTTTAYDTWTEIASDTGEGVISLLTAYQHANASNVDGQVRLWIDDRVVYTSATDLFQSSLENNEGVCIIGIISDDQNSVGLDFVRFNSRFKLEFKKNTNDANTLTVRSKIRYYKTA